jgi:hypothetical protein
MDRWTAQYPMSARPACGGFHRFDYWDSFAVGPGVADDLWYEYPLECHENPTHTSTSLLKQTKA